MSDRLVDPLLSFQERAQAEAAGTPFQAQIGYRLIAWTEDYALLDYLVLPSHLNRTGRLHGGVVATLLDTAAGFAGVFTPDPETRRTAVTLSLTVNYLGTARAGRLLTEARRTGGGRSIFFAEAQTRTEDGTLIATAAATFKYLSPDHSTPHNSPAGS